MEMNLSFLDNKYVSIILSVLLAVYGGLAAPTLPPFIKKLLDNEIELEAIFTLDDFFRG